MNTLVLGRGKLGKHLERIDGFTSIPRIRCDVTKKDQIVDLINSIPSKPDVIVNSAAKTNLEDCEKNKSIAFQTNTVGVANILDVCSDMGIKFVQISSGCLFDGNDSVSTEETQPTPSVWYTYTKKWADEYIQNYGYNDYLILRPRQMVSAISDPTNMITKFCNYEKIYAHDELNSITCVEDFCKMLLFLLENNKVGVYNCCNDGAVTPYEIASGIKKHIKPELEVILSTYEYTLNLQENRRVNTILANDKLKEAGFKPRSAVDALEWCLANYKK